MRERKCKQYPRRQMRLKDGLRQWALTSWLISPLLAALSYCICFFRGLWLFIKCVYISDLLILGGGKTLWVLASNGWTVSVDNNTISVLLNVFHIILMCLFTVHLIIFTREDFCSLRFFLSVYFFLSHFLT